MSLLLNSTASLLVLTCSKLFIKPILELQDMFKINNKDRRPTPTVLVPLFLALIVFCKTCGALSQCFHFQFQASKCLSNKYLFKVLNKSSSLIYKYCTEQVQRKYARGLYDVKGFLFSITWTHVAINLSDINNRNDGTICEIWSKLITETTERCQ